MNGQFPRGNMYRNPQPNNNQWRPHGSYSQNRVQYRPNTRHFNPMVRHSIDNTNSEHWCETCDRSFNTADLLDKHKQQHQKCNIDGCQFIAHPKVITKHIQMQHSSGLYKKIAKLDNPEEVKKWREERKKKYPTRSNIEKKAAEQKEKIERGEKMALKQDRFKSNHNNTTDSASGVKRKHNWDKNNRNNKPNTNHSNSTPIHKHEPQKKKVPRTIPKIPSMIEKNRLIPFAGLSSIDMDEDNKVEDTSDIVNNVDSSLFDDDYIEEPISVECPKQESVLCGALTSLVCDYGSSDDETNQNENVTISNIELESQIKMDNKSTNEDIKTVNDQELGTVSNCNKDIEVVNDSIKTSVAQMTEDISNKNDNISDDDTPEEVKTVKSKEETDLPQQDKTENVRKNVPQKTFRESKNNSSRKIINKYKPKVPSTLLYKLLHKEIRQERNIVLQCIRYIKKMDYFDKPQQ